MPQIRWNFLLANAVVAMYSVPLPAGHWATAWAVEVGDVAEGAVVGVEVVVSVSLWYQAGEYVLLVDVVVNIRCRATKPALGQDQIAPRLAQILLGHTQSGSKTNDCCKEEENGHQPSDRITPPDIDTLGLAAAARAHECVLGLMGLKSRCDRCQRRWVAVAVAMAVDVRVWVQVPATDACRLFFRVPEGFGVVLRFGMVLLLRMYRLHCVVNFH